VKLEPSMRSTVTSPSPTIGNSNWLIW